MKTKQKAIRRVSSPLHLSPAVENMDCEPPVLKRKQLVCDNIGPHTCPDKTKKKICSYQAELPHQHVFHNTSTATEKNSIIDNTRNSPTITSQCKSFSITLCLCLISTDSVIFFSCSILGFIFHCRSIWCI